MGSNNENNVSESTGGSIWQSLNSGARSKLVQLINSGMPTAMMADFLNLEPNQLAELLEVPELKQLIAQQEAAERLNSADASSKWDEVEVLALKNVLGELNSRPDPVFALKAAAVANRQLGRIKASNRLCSSWSRELRLSHCSLISRSSMPLLMRGQWRGRFLSRQLN